MEDDRDIREGMVDLLEDYGLRTRVASNGQEALDILLTSEPLPSLILLDLMMPVMSGQDLVIQLAERLSGRRPPICVLTAAPRFAAGLDVEAVLRKPFDEDELMAIVDRHCRDRAPDTHDG